MIFSLSLNRIDIPWHIGVASLILHVCLLGVMSHKIYEKPSAISYLIYIDNYVINLVNSFIICVKTSTTKFCSHHIMASYAINHSLYVHRTVWWLKTLVTNCGVLMMPKHCHWEPFSPLAFIPHVHQHHQKTQSYLWVYLPCGNMLDMGLCELHHGCLV